MKSGKRIYQSSLLPPPLLSFKKGDLVIWKDENNDHIGLKVGDFGIIVREPKPSDAFPKHYYLIHWLRLKKETNEWHHSFEIATK